MTRRDLGDDVIFLGSVSNVVDVFCKNGHRRTDQNSYAGPKGRRVCRDCKADRARKKHDKWKAANVASQVGEADVPEPETSELEPLPVYQPPPAVTDFSDALDEFYPRLETDWTSGKLYVATRAQRVRRRAQVALAMDTSTKEKLLAYVDAKPFWKGSSGRPGERLPRRIGRSTSRTTLLENSISVRRRCRSFLPTSASRSSRLTKPKGSSRRFAGSESGRLRV